MVHESELVKRYRRALRHSNEMLAGFDGRDLSELSLQEHRLLIRILKGKAELITKLSRLTGQDEESIRANYASPLDSFLPNGILEE